MTSPAPAPVSLPSPRPSFFEASLAAAQRVGALLANQAPADHARLLTTAFETAIAQAPGAPAQWAALREDVAQQLALGHQAVVIEVVVRLEAHAASDTWAALLATP